MISTLKTIEIIGEAEPTADIEDCIRAAIAAAITGGDVIVRFRHNKYTYTVDPKKLIYQIDDAKIKTVNQGKQDNQPTVNGGF